MQCLSHPLYCQWTRITFLHFFFLFFFLLQNERPKYCCWTHRITCVYFILLRNSLLLFIFFYSFPTRERWKHENRIDMIFRIFSHVQRTVCIQLFWCKGVLLHLWTDTSYYYFNIINYYCIIMYCTWYYTLYCNNVIYCV
jgi:hypothetical protein